MRKKNHIDFLVTEINRKLKEGKECNWEALELYLINDTQRLRKRKIGIEILKVIKYLPIWLSPLFLLIDLRDNIIGAIVLWLGGTLIIGAYCIWIGEIICEMEKAIKAYDYDVRMRMARANLPAEISPMKNGNAINENAEVWITTIVYQAKREYYYMSNIDEFIDGNKKRILSLIEKYYKLGL